MNRVIALVVFLIRDFSRSLRVIVPPALLLALYRVLFLYGGDVRYFAGMGGAMLAFLAVVSTLLVIGSANRASTYPLLARLPRRAELVAAIVLASLSITAILALLFVIIVLAGHAVPLEAGDLVAISIRWLALFLFVIAAALHLSKLVARGGSNLLAYLFLSVSLVSLQRGEYPALPVLDWLERGVSFVLAPVMATISGAPGPAAFALQPSAIGLTLLYAGVLYALAIWLFARKDLVWAE